MQSSPLSGRHYLQLKIRTWTGAENDRLLDTIPVISRSTSGVACRCPETQPRKQRPSLAWKDEFSDSISVANNVDLPAMIAGLTRMIAGSFATNVGLRVRQLLIMSVDKHTRLQVCRFSIAGRYNYVLTGQATALDVAYRLASIIDAIEGCQGQPVPNLRPQG